MKTLPLTVFGLERSVYTRIVRLALMEKGVPHTLETVEIFGPEGVPPEHWARHPFGRIPTLSHGDFMVYETAAITRYVDEAFGGPPLQPATPAGRAAMNQLIGMLDSYGYRPMVWGVFVERMRASREGSTDSDPAIAQALGRAEPVLRVLEQTLAQSVWLAGPELSLADLHAYPILRCFAVAPEGQATLARHACLSRWMAVMGERPSVVATRTRYELEAAA